jgi:Ca2+-binding RTX toxin-like protein
MTTYNFSALTDGQDIAFNPENDVLNFDNAGTSASLVVFATPGADIEISIASGPEAGKTITLLSTQLAQLTTTNITFADGSLALFGDNTTGTVADGGGNTLTGTSSDDQLQGLGGNDTLRQTQGGDVLAGGAGFDTLDFTQTGIAYGGTTGVAVNLEAQFSDLDAKVAGEDSTVIGIEMVIGTAGNDVFNAGYEGHGRDSLGNNTLEIFRGNGGNDFITGAGGSDFGGEHRITGDGGADILVMTNFTLVADYSGNTSAQAVNADLLTGRVTDGLGGTDTLINVDGLHGGAGNDILTGGSINRGGNGTFFEILRGNAGNDRLDGSNSTSGGTDSSSDLADYSNNTSAQAVNVNLGTGVAQDGRGGTDTLTGIDQVAGGAGNDTFTGSSGNDSFDGGAGNDILNGGNGTDEARFQQSTAGVIVNLSAGAITVDSVTVAANRANDGMGGTDTLTSIEDVRGSNFADTLRGSDNVNVRQSFDGGGGNDAIDGGDGIDFASYSSTALALGGVSAFIENGSGTVNDKTGGTDTLSNIEGLTGTNSADTLAGGFGDQSFRGLGRDDSIDGGAGNDSVSYSLDPSGVVVNLATGTATDGWHGVGGLLGMGGTDTLVSIENVEGSNYNDDITGDGNANRLEGGAGNDTLTGGGGADQFVYATAPVAGNADHVTDFVGGGMDQLLLDGSRLPGVTPGPFGPPTSFVSNTSGVATTSSQRLIYNSTNGDLFYDADGSGAGAAQRLFTLDGAPALSAGDIVVYNTAGGPPPSSTRISSEDPSVMVGTESNDTLTGDALENTLLGRGGNDVLRGRSGDDTLDGGTGKDTLNGGSGNDVIKGLAGRDVLSGGDGADRFDFDSVNHSGPTSTKRDTIKDFNASEDKIDLSTIDANGSGAGNGMFTFVDAFGDDATGQLRYDEDRHLLLGSTDDDGAAEFSILLSGVNSMTGSNFIL